MSYLIICHLTQILRDALIGFFCDDFDYPRQLTLCTFHFIRLLAVVSGTDRARAAFRTYHLDGTPFAVPDPVWLSYYPSAWSDRKEDTRSLRFETLRLTTSAPRLAIKAVKNWASDPKFANLKTANVRPLDFQLLKSCDSNSLLTNLSFSFYLGVIWWSILYGIEEQKVLICLNLYEASSSAPALCVEAKHSKKLESNFVFKSVSVNELVELHWWGEFGEFIW